MNRFTVTHEINCSADTFWKIFLDEKFNKTMYVDGLKFNAWSQTDLIDNDKTTTRKCTGSPKANMPAAIQKLMGDSFAYTETGVFDKAAKTWKWSLVPSTMADRIKQEGSLRLESIGENKVRRVAELVIEAKVFGLGGMIESSVEKQLRQGWEDSARFMNDYFAKNPV